MDSGRRHWDCWVFQMYFLALWAPCLEHHLVPLRTKGGTWTRQAHKSQWKGWFIFPTEKHRETLLTFKKKTLSRYETVNIISTLLQSKSPAQTRSRPSRRVYLGYTPWRDHRNDLHRGRWDGEGTGKSIYCSGLSDVSLKTIISYANMRTCPITSTCKGWEIMCVVSHHSSFLHCVQN